MFDNTSHLYSIPGCLLVRGEDIKAPYKNIQDFQLNPSLIKGLRLVGFTEPSELHKIIAPNILQGSDTTLIAADGGTHEGRNKRAMSYLPPLLHVLLEKLKNSPRLNYTEPPDAVIIVNSYNSGVHLETYMHQLMNFSQELRIKFQSKDTDQTNKSWKMIQGGINILIITIKYLAEVIKTREGSFLLSKLQYLVFEEIELYLKRYKDEILTFIAAAKEYVKINQNNIQTLFSASKWLDEMDQFITPIIVISAPIQVLRYAKIKWKVRHVENEIAKLEYLKYLLQMKEHNRIVVACSTLQTAYSAYDYLINTSGMVEVQLVIPGYKETADGIVIISDDMMNQVDITDATCLICYDSAPVIVQGGVRRSITAKRFGYLWKNIPSTTQNLEAHFLMTGNEPNFYQMYKFGHTLGDIADFSQTLKQLGMSMDEKNLQFVQMCQGTKLFGFCNHPDEESCQSRHSFLEKELSSPPSAPLTGEIEVQIIKCENPSFYQVRLLRHFTFESGKRICSHSYEEDTTRRHDQLTKFYKVNTKRLQTFNEGTWCAVNVHDSDEDNYVRGKIEKIMKKPNSPMIARVYGVDSGMILNRDVGELLELPVEFQEWKPLVVNLILCNLKPILGETNYRLSSERKAKSLTEGQIYSGKIWLSISDILWVNPLVEYKVETSTKALYKGDSVRLQMINDRIADNNAAHLELLMQLVNQFPGIYKGHSKIPKRTDKSIVHNEFHEIGDAIQWGYIECSSRRTVKPAKIVTQFAYNPWIFFGVQDKHFDLLKNLEKELHASVDVDTKGRFSNYKQIFNKDFYKVGMIVAAKVHEEEKYFRGLIMQILTEEFEIFLVDYGDTVYVPIDDLFPIRREFVTRLPFQIIAFKLDHVKPLQGKEQWGSEEKHAFFDIILKDELSIDVELLAYEDTNDVNNDPLPCRYYSAVAFYKNSELGSLLVDMGSADWKEGKEDFITEMHAKLLEFYNETVNHSVEEADDDDFSMLEEIYDINIGNAPSQDTKLLQKSSAEGIKEKSGTNAGLLNPQVLWHQTEDAFILTINVTDIKDYVLMVLEDKNTIDFQTLALPQNYGFKIKFYGKVEQQFSATLTGLHLMITFHKKMKGHLWTRPLYYKHEKYIWFRGDVDHLCDEDSTKTNFHESVIRDLPEDNTKVKNSYSSASDSSTYSSSDETDDLVESL